MVGSEVVRLLHEQRDDLAARVGAPLELAGIAVRRPQRARDLPVDPALFTADAAGLVARDDVDIVVEVIGGIEPARSWLLAALAAGKSVVTANKALLAEHGAALHDAAAERGVDLYYEASVAGAIPLLRPLRESLAGDRITRVLGIVNGTTNYILTRMDETGAGFAEALDEATALGYAEADPSADVEGFDAAAKAAILAGLAFHTPGHRGRRLPRGHHRRDRRRRGERTEMGCTVKLLAIAERTTARPGVSVRVHPAMIPRSHPLAGVREAFNAVFVEAEAAGQLMFYGRGAGGAPTASAVLGDLVAVARNRLGGSRGAGSRRTPALPVRPMGETRHPLPHQPRRGRQGRRARPGRRGLRRARRVDRQRPAGGSRRRRQPGAGDPHAPPTPRSPPPWTTCATLDVVRAVASVMRVEGES